MHILIIERCLQLVHKFSRCGSFHRKNHISNQDALSSKSTERFQVITLADGVSTCSQAKTGATIASRSMCKLYSSESRYFFSYTKERIVRYTFDYVLYQLRNEAKMHNYQIEDYSCTLAGVLLDRKDKKALVFNLGDSIILGVRPDSFSILAQPFDSSLNGCCVLTTINAQSATTIHVIDVSEYKSIIIFSDGAWHGMFSMGKMNLDVRNLLIKRDYQGLKHYFVMLDQFDDNSFIALDVNEEGDKQVCMKEAS